MIDFRLYRIAWLPAVLAFVTMMFSLEGVPEPLQPQVAPTAFDGDRAQVNERQILNAAAEREAGSDGDAAVGDLVLDRFKGIEAGTPADQPFTESIDGDDAELRNIAVTLPGESDRTILVMAARDSASGPGAASSAAATAALIELAEVLGGTEHTKTIVVVSTDAGTDGAIGAREFVDAYPDADLIDAAIVLSQPGSAQPDRPHVLRDSTGDESTSAQLVRTAEQAVSDHADRPPAERSTFSDLARLAMPAAAGEQSVLIADGLDAIAISSAGEEPLPPDRDEPDDFDIETLTQFGSAALGAVLVLDQTTASLDHGPDTYIRFAGNLIPGWAVAILALAMLAPAALAAIDGVARAARRRAGIVRAITWTVGLAVPLLGALVAIYLLALIGLIARPRYPFDPGRFGIGIGEVLLMLILAGGLVAGYVLTGLGDAPARARRQALVPALGAAGVLGALVTWLLNPFLALLLVPAAHIWLIGSRDRAPGRALTLVAVVLALLPAALALRVSTAAIGAGPWDLLLSIADGHIGAVALIALCPLAGSLIGLVILAGREPDERVEAGEARAGGPPGAALDYSSTPL